VSLDVGEVGVSLRHKGADTRIAVALVELLGIHDGHDLLAQIPLLAFLWVSSVEAIVNLFGSMPPRACVPNDGTLHTTQSTADLASVRFSKRLFVAVVGSAVNADAIRHAVAHRRQLQVGRHAGPPRVSVVAASEVGADAAISRPAERPASPLLPAR
jgi:hypothetical protein